MNRLALSLGILAILAAPATAQQVHETIEFDIEPFPEPFPMPIDIEGGGGDSTPPASPMLTVIGVTTDSVTLEWTVSGDNGLGGGPVDEYRMYYSIVEPDGDIYGWIADATRVGDEPVPADPVLVGTQQMTVQIPAGYPGGTLFYFVLEVVDSDLYAVLPTVSNTASAQTVVFAPDPDPTPTPDPGSGGQSEGSGGGCGGSASGMLSTAYCLLSLITLRSRK